MKKILTGFVAAFAATIALALTGCAASTPVTATDPWGKATTAEMSNMTGLFMTLNNTTDHDLTIVGATSTVTDDVEVHEMAMVDGQMVMQEVQDDLVIPAGGSFEFKPGGNHFMFMGLTDALEPGEFVDLTIEFDDGTSLTVNTEIREWDAANETYVEN
ncbi:MAG: copper chaperone PCu(A)C [Microbacteriaceae bacterium]